MSNHLPEESIKFCCKSLFVHTLKVVSMVTAGYRHSAAITDDGCLYTWGEGDYGRLGIFISVGLKYINYT